MELENKFKIYYLTAIFSLVFAVVGFSYNAWRMEVTEDNSNIRTAAFEVLKELTALEQIIYSAHYDKDMVEGNPRKGWVKMGLIVDLSTLINESVLIRADSLNQFWASNWEVMPDDRSVADELVLKIESVRAEIKKVLSELQ
ncbi:MAG TPA: hypothetical protein VIQ03_02210 [Gammaproteobacteria bacterium]